MLSCFRRMCKTLWMAFDLCRFTFHAVVFWKQLVCVGVQWLFIFFVIVLKPFTSLQQEVLWREDWPVFCLVRSVHTAADSCLSFRSRSIPVRMPHRRHQCAQVNALTCLLLYHGGVFFNGQMHFFPSPNPKSNPHRFSVRLYLECLLSHFLCGGLLLKSKLAISKICILEYLHLN